MRHATTTIGGALAAALVAHERALGRRWTAARSGDVTAVHRARVASRRLREVLAVAAAVDRAGPADLLRFVRRLTRVLGPTREMDVALDELGRAAARHGWPDEAVAIVRARLARERSRRAARLASKAERPGRGPLRRRAAALAGDMSAIADSVWLKALTERVIRRAARVVVTSAACGTLYAPDRLHALRIAIKKLRYALELVPAAVDDGLQPLVRTLKGAQDRFGHLHDLQVLAADVHALEARRRHAERTGIALVLEGLERDCREIHASVLALIPDVDAAARDARRRMKMQRAGRHPVMARARVDASGADQTAVRTARSGS
jgi:CHAD domain-containing protein